MSKEDKDIEKELSQDNLIYEHVYKNSKQNLANQVQQYIKTTTYLTKLELLDESTINIRKINVLHHTNRPKRKNNKTILIDAISIQYLS